jgi:hypothetical protein
MTYDGEELTLKPGQLLFVEPQVFGRVSPWRRRRPCS